MRVLGIACAVLFALLGSPAAHAQGADDSALTGSACVPKQTANSFLTAHQGKFLIKFMGTTIFDHDDPTYKTDAMATMDPSHDLEMYLIRYIDNSKYNWALVKRDNANLDRSTKICLVAIGEFEGNLGDARDDAPETKNWFTNYDRLAALSQCNRLRELVQGLDEPYLITVENAIATDLQNMVTLGCGSKYASPDLCRKAQDSVQADTEKRQKEKEEQNKNGDRYCSSLDDQITRERSAGFRLVTEIVGQLYVDGHISGGKSVFSFFLPISNAAHAHHWMAYRTDSLGATHILGEGPSYTPTVQIFEDAASSGK